MAKNLGFELPLDVRNISHDFRIAIYSFLRPFTEISNFHFSSAKEKADLIITPEGVTNVTFGCSVASAPQGGEFTLVGGLVGEETQSPKTATSTTVKLEGTSYTFTDQSATEDPDNRLSNKAASGVNFRDGDVEVRGMDIGAMFANTDQIIKPMDYVIIYTKDIRTNLWHGSKQFSNSAVPDDALPKFIGIVTDVNTNYNATTHRMEFTIKFKTMLRLVELARFSTERIMYPILEKITGKPFDEFEKDFLREAKSFASNTPPNEIIKLSLRSDYPNELLGKRIESDQLRGEIQGLNFEVFSPMGGVNSIQGQGNYETKLNKIRQFATNKDFEFYADEEGQLVWKLPTYARGINQKDSNKVTTEVFDPDNPSKETRDTIYHIHDLISFSFQKSESEIVNVITGANDLSLSGAGNINFNHLSFARFTYFIKGGKDTPTNREVERQFGFLDVGVRPMNMQNPLGYNPKKNLLEDQLKYYDFKAYKNNIGRYITGTLTMIDDPRIKCGMPCIIPMLAETGRGKLKGKIMPAIFYIFATNRRYEYQKAPILTLSLTHGRFVDQEFTNGLHLFGNISSWMKIAEPELFSDVSNSEGRSYNLTNSAPNDARVQEVIQFLNNAKKQG